MCYLWTPGTQQQRETAASKFKNANATLLFTCLEFFPRLWFLGVLRWSERLHPPSQHLAAFGGICSNIQVPGSLRVLPSVSNPVRCYQGVLSANPICIFFFLSFKPGLRYVHIVPIMHHYWEGRWLTGSQTGFKHSFQTSFSSFLILPAHFKKTAIEYCQIAKCDTVYIR